MWGIQLIVPTAVLSIGLFAVVLAAEFYDLRFGGVVVVPLLAVYVLFDMVALPMFVISATAAYVTLAIIERRLVLYGRRLFMTAIVAGALVPITTVLLTELWFQNTVILSQVAYLGSILPGIAAYNLHRLEREDQIADIVGGLSLLVGLILLAAFFLLIDSIMSLDTPLLEAIVATAQQLVVGGNQPNLTRPNEALPREVVVGLFVLGLLANEAVRQRYGLRLAGIIAIPLVAVFTVQDFRFLALYLFVTAVTAGYIRIIHRSTFLYGRNLLGGACVVGVIIGTVSTPLLPGASGLRPHIVGILGAVTAYNGHALAPGERIQSAIVSAGAFVSLFGLATAVAHLLDKPFAYPVDPPSAAIGATILLAAVIVLYDFERKRPEGVQTVSFDEQAAIPDGGTADEPGEVVLDGGQDVPLANREVVEYASNATVVTRDGGAEHP